MGRWLGLCCKDSGMRLKDYGLVQLPYVEETLAWKAFSPAEEQLDQLMWWTKPGAESVGLYHLRKMNNQSKKKASPT